MKVGAVSGPLVVLVILPCLAAAVAFSFDHLGNQMDSVLRFVKEKARGDKSRPQTVVSDHFTAPAFCNKLDCPQFTILKNGSNYQLREYKPTQWVSTTSIGIDFDTAQYQDFMRLFHYISGENEKKQKIAMTAPVLNRIIPGQGPACANNFTMSFYVSPKEGQPPSPSDQTVFLSKLPTLRVYVRSFGGFASKDKWLSEAVKLTEDLAKEGATYVKEHFYTAGYDSPFKLLNRHNEVWFIAQ